MFRKSMTYFNPKEENLVFEEVQKQRKVPKKWIK